MFIFLNHTSGYSQTFITNSQEIRLGFYGGRGGYFGEYNPGPFGNPFVYGFEETEIASGTRFGENNFGGWIKLPLNNTFSVLVRADFGSITYQDAVLQYRMAGNFSGFGASLEINPFKAFLIQPYLTAGAGTMRYATPPPIPDSDLQQYSPDAFNKKSSAIYFPVSVGVSYPFSDRTSFFMEYGFNVTNADNLDNLALPAAVNGATLGNDAFGGVRVGMQVALLKVFNLRRNKRSVRRPVYPEAMQLDATQVEREKLRPLKLVPADTLMMYYAANKEESDKTKALAATKKQIPDPVPAVVTPVPVPVKPPLDLTPKKVAVAKPPEERVFKQEAEKEKVQQVTIDRQKARAEARAAEEARKNAGVDAKTDESPAPEITSRPTAKPIASKKELKNVVDRTDPTLYTDETDPFIPKVMIKPRAIPEEIIVDGFVTRDPPVGYYVQVYATIGPISAQRNRQQTIDLLKEVLEDAELQVIITQRRQFYEVRIGVFDSYDDTVQVLEQVLGTYYDAYTLIYLTDTIQ